MKELVKYYCADFETTTDAISKTETNVWLWYIENIFDDTDFALNKEIKDFFHFLEEMDTNTQVFFHNLNWDGEFILNYLVDNYIYVKQEVGKFNVALKAGEWSNMSDGVSSHYVIRFKNKKYGKEIKFLCSLKHLTVSVATLQGLKEKVKIDYDKIVVNEETISYIKKDVKTVIPFMKGVIENYGKQIGITSSGTAMKQFKKTLDGDYDRFFTNQIKVGKFNNQGYYTDGEWDYYKKAYKGGWTFLREEYKEKLLKGNIICDDFNSLYPYIMRNFSHPVGKALPCNEKKCNCFKILEINLDADLIEPNIPCIPDKTGYEQHINYLKTARNQLIYVTDEYWDLIKETYTIHRFKIIKETHFFQMSDIFTKYIDKWQEMKQNSKKGTFEYLFSKLMQNQLYGKFGMTPVRQKYFFRNFDPNIDKRKGLPIYGRVNKMVLDYNWDTTKPSYIPMAISITDKAKIQTIRVANIVNKCNHIMKYGGFIYSDTDSIHFNICDDCLKEYESKVDIHPSKLGSLDRERVSKYGYFIKRKFYLEFNDLNDKIDSRTCGMAGINKEDMETYTYNDFIFDRKNVKTTKKQRVKVNGGVMLIKKEVNI